MVQRPPQPTATEQALTGAGGALRTPGSGNRKADPKPRRKSFKLIRTEEVDLGLDLDSPCFSSSQQLHKDGSEDGRENIFAGGSRAGGPRALKGGSRKVSATPDPRPLRERLGLAQGRLGGVKKQLGGARPLSAAATGPRASSTAPRTAAASAAGASKPSKAPASKTGTPAAAKGSSQGGLNAFFGLQRPSNPTVAQGGAQPPSLALTPTPPEPPAVTPSAAAAAATAAAPRIPQAAAAALTTPQPPSVHRQPHETPAFVPPTVAPGRRRSTHLQHPQTASNMAPPAASSSATFPPPPSVSLVDLTTPSPAPRHGGGLAAAAGGAHVALAPSNLPISSRTPASASTPSFVVPSSVPSSAKRKPGSAGANRRPPTPPSATAGAGGEAGGGFLAAARPTPGSNSGGKLSGRGHKSRILSPPLPSTAAIAAPKLSVASRRPAAAVAAAPAAANVAAAAAVAAVMEKPGARRPGQEKAAPQRGEPHDQVPQEEEEEEAGMMRLHEAPIEEEEGEAQELLLQQQEEEEQGEGCFGMATQCAADTLLSFGPSSAVGATNPLFEEAWSSHSNALFAGASDAAASAQGRVRGGKGAAAAVGGATPTDRTDRGSLWRCIHSLPPFRCPPTPFPLSPLHCPSLLPSLHSLHLRMSLLNACRVKESRLCAWTRPQGRKRSSSNRSGGSGGGSSPLSRTEAPVPVTRGLCSSGSCRRDPQVGRHQTPVPLPIGLRRRGPALGSHSQADAGRSGAVVVVCDVREPSSNGSICQAASFCLFCSFSSSFGSCGSSSESRSKEAADGLCGSDNGSSCGSVAAIASAKRAPRDAQGAAAAEGLLPPGPIWGSCSAAAAVPSCSGCLDPLVACCRCRAPRQHLGSAAPPPSPLSPPWCCPPVSVSAPAAASSSHPSSRPLEVVASFRSFGRQIPLAPEKCCAPLLLTDGSVWAFVPCVCAWPRQWLLRTRISSSLQCGSSAAASGCAQMAGSRRISSSGQRGGLSRCTPSICSLFLPSRPVPFVPLPLPFSTL